jgi:hypothetical protein
LISIDTETDIEYRYNRIKGAVHKAAKEALGHRDDKGKVVQPWWNEEIKPILKEKKRAFNRWLVN